jgi:DNA recombination protein RmuC
MDSVLSVFILVIGFIGGWILSFYISKKNSVNKEIYNKLLNEKDLSDYKLSAVETDLKKAEAESAIVKQELKVLREDFSTINSVLAAEKTKLINKETETKELKIQIGDLMSEIYELKELLSKIKEEKISIEEKNKNLIEKLQTQTEEIEKIGEKFSNEFKVLANAILEEKSKKFTEQNKEHLKVLLDPLGENLKEFRKKVEETYDKESKERFSLESEIKKLAELNQQISKEANNLTHALKSSVKTQGNWGEMILETILENSGLEKGREFFVQEFLKDSSGQTITNSEGKKMQPDVIVKYPDGRNIIIDSKVSLIAYERFVNSENEADKQRELKLHIQSLKSHIDGLSSKDYNLHSETLDFVMLFVPIEPAYLLAMKTDNELWNYAYKKKVLLISPTNLIAALKLVADLWKREHQNKNAFDIAERGGKLYDKFVSFIERLSDIGTHIERAQKSYDSAYKQLTEGKGNIVGQVEKLKELGVKAQKSIPDNLLSE